MKRVLRVKKRDRPGLWGEYRLGDDANEEDRARTKEPGRLEEFLSRSDGATRLIQLLLATATAIGSVEALANAHPLRLALSVAALVIVAAWVTIGAYLRRRRPQTHRSAPSSRPASSYLRNLRPFDKHDQLEGRDKETGQLFSMVRGLEFRFGFVSGEAGAGKTSLLRAKLVPALEAEGWRPIYIPRTGPDPGASIRKAVTALLPADNKPADDASIGDVLRHATAAIAGQTVLVIIDQFEEYFVFNRPGQSRQRFDEFLGEVLQASSEGAPIRLLFALRKEFVDDLLDFGVTIPDLQNTRWRLPIRNLSQDTAREVLRKVAEREGLQFSEQLQDIVIADLSHDGRVRPVEFQIVLTHLLEQEVFDVAAYRSVQGAQGVIGRFVRDTIEPPGQQITDLERRVARHALRMLCNKEFTTRRPVGLSQSEMVDRVAAEVRDETHTSVTRTECELALDRVLHRFISDFIVIREDDQRLNLAHDYLASPVRDATADIETVEERADRMLEQYVAQARLDRHLLLPFRTLRFIQRFAGSDVQARPEAAALINRSRQRVLLLGCAGALTALALITVLLPIGVGFPVRERLEISGRRVLSADGRLLAIQDGSKLFVMRVDDAGFLPRELPLQVYDVQLSPRGDALVALGLDGHLYVASAGNNFTPEKRLEGVGWNQQMGPWRLRGWANFSPDGAWIIASSASGSVYAWPVNSNPRRVLALSSLPDLFGRPVAPRLTPAGGGPAQPAAAPRDRSVPPPVDEPTPPNIGVARANQWLWAIDGEGRLYLVNLASSDAAERGPVLTLQSDRDRQSIVPSPDGSWLAIGDEASEVRLVRLGSPTHSPQIRTVLALGESELGLSNVRIAFSPDGNWLVARRSYESFFATRLDASGTATPHPAVAVPRSGADQMGPISFDPSSRFAAGMAQDRLIHVWELASPPGNTSTPVYREEVASFSDRSQNAFFCPDAPRALVSGGDGTLHVVHLETPVRAARQIDRLPPGNLRFLAGSNNQVVAYNASRVAAGRCGESLRTVLDHSSDVRALSSDGRGNLIVVGTRDLLRVGRYYYVWGIPVWRMPWLGMVTSRAHED